MVYLTMAHRFGITRSTLRLLVRFQSISRGDLLPIEASFGSFEEFLSKFSNAAATLGSGALAVVDTDGKLNITRIKMPVIRYEKG